MVVVERCRGLSGGGIAIGSARRSSSMSLCRITQLRRCRKLQPANFGGGGGVVIVGGGTNPTFRSCSFRYNLAAADIASGGGGGVYVQNGAVVGFEGCTFEANTASQVVVYSWMGQASLNCKGCIFRRNQAASGRVQRVTGGARIDVRGSRGGSPCSLPQLHLRLTPQTIMVAGRR